MGGKNLPFFCVRDIFMLMEHFVYELTLIIDPGTRNQTRNSNRLLHEAGFGFEGLQNLSYRINLIYEKNHYIHCLFHELIPLAFRAK